ncbi:heterodisulfide reductase-related iron-sulfur binding cluster [Janibacter sp. G1551]|uniref:heterodisulfide reductase-related iron-sulfur binding cluster n=1 Tax=Janibacter sp. G1551 TaxID=3420440 RepID=UPI003D00BF90
MSALQIIAIILSLSVTLVGVTLLARVIGHFLRVFRLGQAEVRTDRAGARTATLLREFLGHTRMSRLPVVAIAHWFTMVSFGVLFFTLVNAFGQLFKPEWALPLIGHFPPYEWITEFFAVMGLLGIITLMVIRQKNHPRSAAGTDGRRSRFFGSNWWQAYYVEFTILGVAICIALLRGLEYALDKVAHGGEHANALHFPFMSWLGGLFDGLSQGTLENAIIIVATIKILISFAWMITISLTPTMGVAWHRFLAFFNIFLKRHADGRTSLGELQPITVGGKPFDLEAMEDLEEDDALGVGKVEDFTWKGLLDFSTCTECGRCQSQCPAWNTDKPLSPKLLMMTLRDHSHAKAPFLLAGGATDGEGSVATKEHEGDAINWSDLSLIGDTGYDIDHPLSAYNPHGPDAVIDQDVLWSCTTCGACVEQCPVDIEHVDHIVDMRRYQTLIESAFPNELGGLFKNLEGKGNPWGMSARARLEWAKDLPFDVKVAGTDLENLDEVDYLFWVGCAGAYEDRAKKTSRAVAELLDTAGVSFAVLGDGETCTGDSARRAGNEVLFQMLAAQNVETLNEMGATKIVVTCAHCFNTIKNEYPQLGGKYEVVHHTQLLNRLVREKKLTPVARPADHPGKSTLKNVASTAATVTYHDPCYLGRHNNVYAPPRELIGALPGVELKEMERTKEKSFCCGAGGARMWMEEKLGSRINMNRTEEALATGAERIAVGCPFCRVMMTDGLTAKQAEGVGEDVEVVDVAQMLLAAVRHGEQVAAEESDEPAAVAAAPAVTDEAQVAEPTVEEPKVEAPKAAEPATASTPAWDTPAPKAEQPKAAATPAWDTPAPKAEEPKAEEPTVEAPKASTPAWDKPAEQKTAAWDTPAPKAEEPKAEQKTPAWDTPAPKAEEPKAEQKTPAWDTPAPKAEEPKAEQKTPAWDTPAPKAEEPKAEEPTVEAPKVEEAPKASTPAWDKPTEQKTPAWDTPAPKAEEPKAEQKTPAWDTPAPKAEQPKAEEPTVEAPKASTPAWDKPTEQKTPAWDTPAPKAEEPKAEEPTVEAPKVEESVQESKAAETPKASTPAWDKPTEQKTPAWDTPAPKAEQPKAEEHTVEAPKVEEPAVEEAQAVAPEESPVDETPAGELPVEVSTPADTPVEAEEQPEATAAVSEAGSGSWDEPVEQKRPAWDISLSKALERDAESN